MFKKVDIVGRNIRSFCRKLSLNYRRRKQKNFLAFFDYHASDARKRKKGVIRSAESRILNGTLTKKQKDTFLDEGKSKSTKLFDIYAT